MSTERKFEFSENQKKEVQETAEVLEKHKKIKNPQKTVQYELLYGTMIIMTKP